MARQIGSTLTDNANDIPVETACNGRDALELLEKQYFDGVLMDCQMPVMNGFEATEEIRKQPKYVDLPIIALTASVLKSDREQVFAVGMNDFVHKPIEPEVMFKTMAKWISPKS